jgi:hypothetical protein
MKKKIKNQSASDRSVSDRIKKVNEAAKKWKAIRKLCDKMVWFFDMPCNQGMEGSEIELSSLIDEISPWQNIDHNDEEFSRLWSAVKVSFGFGYALGQMLDLPDIDITPIKELLREKRALLYMPHEKKAA